MRRHKYVSQQNSEIWGWSVVDLSIKAQESRGFLRHFNATLNYTSRESQRKINKRKKQIMKKNTKEIIITFKSRARALSWKLDKKILLEKEDAKEGEAEAFCLLTNGRNFDFSKCVFCLFFLFLYRLPVDHRLLRTWPFAGNLCPGEFLPIWLVLDLLTTTVNEDYLALII